MAFPETVQGWTFILVLAVVLVQLFREGRVGWLVLPVKQGEAVAAVPITALVALVCHLKEVRAAQELALVIKAEAGVVVLRLSAAVAAITVARAAQERQIVTPARLLLVLAEAAVAWAVLETQVLAVLAAVVLAALQAPPQPQEPQTLVAVVAAAE